MQTRAVRDLVKPKALRDGDTVALVTPASYVALVLRDGPSSGNVDTMIADPAQFTASELETWAKSLNDSVTTNAFSILAIQSPLAQKKLEKWCDAKSEC